MTEAKEHPAYGPGSITDAASYDDEPAAQDIVVVSPTQADLDRLTALSFEPADKLRQLAAEYQRDGFSRKAAELEIIADGLEALALRGLR